LHIYTEQGSTFSESGTEVNKLMFLTGALRCLFGNVSFHFSQCINKLLLMT